MGTLWTFGCSFTAEYNPVGDKFVRNNYDEYKDWRGGIRTALAICKLRTEEYSEIF